jgi:Recombination endonuclease VII
MDEPNKRCSQCGVVKPLSQFHLMVTGRDGHRSECAACSCDRVRRWYKPRGDGLVKLICQHCGTEFEYVKTSGPRRFYCTERCRYQAGEAAKKQRAALKVRACACGSFDVARVGKPVCPDCRKDPRDSEAVRLRERRRTLRLYNLSEAEWQGWLVRLNGRCPICRTTDPGSRGWQIDHDRACCPGTGSCGRCVRGLLCFRCNLMLGQANDQPETLRAAIVYLAGAATAEHTGTGPSSTT